MKEYEVLVGYLRESNFNEDGSPSQDQDYYKIMRVKANSEEQATKLIDDYMIDDMFDGLEDDYAEDTLYVVKVLASHKVA